MNLKNKVVKEYRAADFFFSVLGKKPFEKECPGLLVKPHGRFLEGLLCRRPAGNPLFACEDCSGAEYGDGRYK